MKNIFKKNHIIITALAIMIVIAGYLSFTNNDAPDDEDLVMTTNPDTDEFGDLMESDGMELATSETDTTDDTTTTEDTTTTDEDLADDTGVTETTDETLEENAETTDDAEAADELGQNDISDEDILQTAQNVTDNGELDLEDGVPGEAVLASAVLDPSFSISTKLDREQMRSKSKATLMEIIESPDISEESKQDAIKNMIALTEIAEKENNAEMMLEAKGFSGAVVFIVDGEVDVVVNAETLTDQQLAIIEDVVKSKTDISVKNIHITKVVVAE